jgi:hypothetical protein
VTSQKILLSPQRKTLSAEWKKLGASLTDDQLEAAIHLIKEKFSNLRAAA